MPTDTHEKVFLSHAWEDKPAADRLRRALEDRGVNVFWDKRELKAGQDLEALIPAVEQCRAFLVFWSPTAPNKRWVARELKAAVHRRWREPGFLVLPVLAGGQTPVSVELFADAELLCLRWDDGVDAVADGVLAALGLRAPDPRPAPTLPEAPPVDELVIELDSPRYQDVKGRHRAAASLVVRHRPPGGPESRGARREFEAPLGPIELEELRWYLERYGSWPFGTHRVRAQEIERKLPAWGRALFDATLRHAPEGAIHAWKASRAERRVIVEVEEPRDERDRMAAAGLLALPWELLEDAEGPLSAGGLGARVSRRLPRASTVQPLGLAPRLRVLLVVARPEEEGVGFIDPRVSARPLAGALAALGDRVELTLLPDGTFEALEKALLDAERADRPFQVVHFDGHGVYRPAPVPEGARGAEARDAEARNVPAAGLAALCFEDPGDAASGKIKRRVDFVGAERLGHLLRQRRVPLFVLEACRSAQSDKEPSASVAGALLQAGVGSVLAMSHAVLVETARRFTAAFYEALVQGERVGTAALAGQRRLQADLDRGPVGGHGRLRLQDWFVPVLYQEPGGDVPLVPRGAVVAEDSRAAVDRRRLGELPDPPKHGFVGRGRQILAIQRLLHRSKMLALIGEGGVGKTATAVEAARWL